GRDGDGLAHRAPHHDGARWRLRAMHVARDQLQPRIGVARPGTVQDADPGPDIEEAIVLVGAFAEDEVVVRPPGNAGSLVGDPRVVATGVIRVDVPKE